MTPAARLTGGVLVLAVYAWTFAPAAPPSGLPGETGFDASVDSSIALANTAFAEGRYVDALDPASKLVERFPTQPVYWERLARIHGKLNRRADEAADWEHFVDVSPTPVDACPAIGHAYARAGQPAKALEAFRRCVTFDPRDAELQFFLGLAYERAGKLDQALDAYTHAATLAPAQGDSQLGLARLALRANRVGEARRAADAVLVRDPSNADALLVAGLAAEREGRLRDARAFLERAVAVADSYVDVHIALGRIDQGQRRHVEARRHFERALELDPSRRDEIAVWLERTARAR